MFSTFLRNPHFCITFRKPPSPLFNEGLSVTPQNARQLTLEEEELNQTGIPANLFSGLITGPTNEQLNSEVTKFRFGCILDLDTVPEDGLDVEIVARFRLGDEHIPVAKSLRVRPRPITQCLQYYSYIKEEIHRLQTNNEESSYRMWGLTQEERDRLQTSIEEQKKVIVNLSTATNLLSALTAFVGVKLVPRPQAQPETPNRPPAARVYDVELIYDPHDMHGSEDNTNGQMDYEEDSDDTMQVDSPPISVRRSRLRRELSNDYFQHGNNLDTFRQQASGYGRPAGSSGPSGSARSSGGARPCGAAPPSRPIKPAYTAPKNPDIEGKYFKSYFLTKEFHRPFQTCTTERVNKTK